MRLAAANTFDVEEIRLCANGRLPWAPRKPRKCARVGDIECAKATDSISAPVQCYPGQAGQDPDSLCFLGFHNRLRTAEAIPSAQPPDDLCANGSNEGNAVQTN